MKLNIRISQNLSKHQNNLRYIPATGATVLAEIARFPDTFGTISNIREIVDFSIRRAATQPFAGDSSVWSLPLTSTDTNSMMSSNVRITLTEGSVISKSLIPVIGKKLKKLWMRCAPV